MPPKRTTPEGYEHGRELRKNPTPAERKLWARLRNRQVKGVKFRRQHAIGKYIPDFCAVKPKLIIELDGSQHLEQEEYDEERTDYFRSLGYRVIRFWNNQISKGSSRRSFRECFLSPNPPQINMDEHCFLVKTLEKRLQTPFYLCSSVVKNEFQNTLLRPGVDGETLRECLIIHHEGHEEARRLEKTRENLCKSVQSMAEFCSREHVNRVAAEFQNTL